MKNALVKVINWARLHKLFTAVIVIVFILIVAIASSGGQSQNPAKTEVQNNPTKTEVTNNPSSTSTTPIQTKKANISYQTTTSNDNYKAIVISSSNVNTSDLTQLGSQLKTSNETLSYIRVFVFDDATAASYIDTVLKMQGTDAQNALYDKHFIAVYAKNQYSGLNNFIIMLEGDQDPNPITINY